MKKIVMSIIQLGVMCLICFSFMNLQAAWASTKISTTKKFAWSENTGWHNWRSTNAEVTMNVTYIEGYVWAENTGWIKLGSGTPSGGAYLNTSSTNWGVNINRSTGELSGYAWGENVGWINFQSTNSDVTVGLDGLFDGYAWGENIGWIHFQDKINQVPLYFVMELVAEKASLTGPAAVAAGVVSTAFTLTTLDAEDTAANVNQDTVFDLTTDAAGTGTFYSDAAGTIEITQVTITTGNSSAAFYYKDLKSGAPTVTAKWKSGGADCGSDTHQITVNAGLVGKVVLTGPTEVTAGAVSTAFTLTSQDDEGNPSTVTTDTVFDLTTDAAGTGTFYSDAAGTTEITQATIGNGSSTVTFYYKDSNAGTPTLKAEWNSGGTDLGSDTLPVTVSLATTTLATSTSVASSFKDYKVTVTKIEMNNGASWIEIFSGTAELDLVNGGTFPGISDVSLPSGTYSQMRVIFKNSLPVTGMLNYDATDYYTTAATFGGASNVACDPSNDPGSQTVFIFKISEWGALNADVTQTFPITPITVDDTTDYQPTLRFTIGKTFLLKGAAGTASTYYLSLSPPTLSIVEP